MLDDEGIDMAMDIVEAGQHDLSEAGQHDLSEAGQHDLSVIPEHNNPPTATDWRDVPLSDLTPGRRRNVARRRAMGGDSSCVPPDFNRSMLDIWEELWQSMPQSGITVNSLLQQYKERCRASLQLSTDHCKLSWRT